MMSIFTAVIYLLIHTTFSKPNYCVPTQSCWPTSQDILNLNSSLSTNTLLLNISDGSIYYQYATIMQTRFYAYPSWILVANDITDIQSGVKWAALHNIQISIMNTGHSYTGRSTANYSLMIQLSHIKYYNISSDYNSITIGAGLAWGEIYTILNASYPSVNRLIVGGSDKSVGAVGGYSQGGGHGLLTPFLGLSCDWIESFTVVDAKGDIIIANNASNDMHIRNLYWSLKGGGGGTFGVVVDATFTLHNPLDISPSGQWTYYESLWSFYDEQTPFKKTLTANNTLNGIWNWMLNIMDDKWMGLILISEDIKYKAVIQLILFYADTMDKAKLNSQFLGNLSTSCKITPDAYYQGDNINDGFLQLFSNNSSPWNTYLFSGLVQNESLTAQYTDLNIELMLNNNPLQSGFAVGNTMVITGGVGNNNKNKNSSVNPLWRENRLILGVAGATAGNASESTINSMVNYVKQREEKWWNFSKGVYNNEENKDCESCSDDPLYDGKWGNAFWGEHYQSLIDIKKYWDPNNVFWCYHCIGDAD